MYAPSVPGVGTYLNDGELEREAVWRSCHSDSGPMDLRGDPTYQPEVDGHTVVKIVRGIIMFSYKCFPCISRFCIIIINVRRRRLPSGTNSGRRQHVNWL